MGSLDNGQAYNTTFFVTYTDSSATDEFVVSSNIPPEFTETIKTLYTLNFSSDGQSPQDSYKLG